MKTKLIIGSVIAAVLISGATIGVALAQTPGPTPPPPSTATPTPDARREAREKALAQHLAKILGIDPAQVESALSQAKEQVKRDAIDAGVKARLDKLVQGGKLSQSDADSLYTWFLSRPAAADDLLPKLGHRVGPGLKRDLAVKRQFGHRAGPGPKGHHELKRHFGPRGHGPTGRSNWGPGGS